MAVKVYRALREAVKYLAMCMNHALGVECLGNKRTSNKTLKRERCIKHNEVQQLRQEASSQILYSMASMAISWVMNKISTVSGSERGVD